MNFKFFNNSEEFVNYYLDNNLDDRFELVVQMIEKDLCYIDDDWIKWCVVEYGGITPLAFIGVRVTSPIDDSVHISAYEINSDFRNLGFGSLVLKEFIKNFCNQPLVSLYAEEKNKNFYQNLGFKNVKDNLFILEK